MGQVVELFSQPYTDCTTKVDIIRQVYHQISSALVTYAEMTGW